MYTQPTRLIRLPVVIEYTGYGKSWIYHLINEGLLAAPVKISACAAALVEREIEEWILLTSSSPRKSR
ncbi:AlpA family phage regulatory protein [Salmonella enterica]|uniref:helix-turn-helix transcriptional regulator n=1 Tax=Enterobacteriaceae TaxID=543 RepID=UPI0005EF1738|nr:MULTISPECIES: AlpA family phage regulatory protein [Enterobacteriaceae]ECJ1282640.1 AlpA family phage regulatory protein [Salmonella enterica subsp. enterica]EHC7475806.1 AlpA family phage regulatory protein [Salmonella enterica subsp. enterica serovar Chomedey]ELY3576711.1 AlpA family phage regulatory protein [Cronobacter sakazakii]MCM6965890.1 AlpA family phage regulatory protein [Enterobacter hormaechei]EAN6342159.1 AlpA family phage regulatory protein [Salmonella enterica]